MNRNTRLVYSTEQGRVDDRKEGKQRAQTAPTDSVVRVGRQTKGRKGAGVTIITGAPLRGRDLKNLAKELKGACGSGGTVKRDVIEIQGDHRDRLFALLQAKGWTVKRAGG